MIKFLVQKIFDFIVRFRGEVYLESVTASTQDDMVVIDSDGKAHKRDIDTIDKLGTIGTGEWRATPIITTYGGTGLSSYTAGDILYYSSSTAFVKLNIGTAGQFLKVNSIGNAPQWSNTSNIDHDSLTNFVQEEHYRWDTDISSTATINAANIPTLNQNTSGTAAGLSSTLAVSSGGTGATSHFANCVLTGNGSSAVQSSSQLQFSGTALNIGTVADHLAQLQITNDNNVLKIGVSNSTNGGIVGTVDGDAFIHSNGNHNICIGQSLTTDLKIDTSGDVVVSNNLDVTGTITGDVTGNVTGNVSGSSGSCTGESATVAVSANTTDSDFPVVFHNSNTLHDDGASDFTYNPSSNNLKIGKLTANNTGSTLAGHVSVGVEDGQDNFHIARYSSSYPYAHIRCGENNLNKTTGFQVVTKNGSTHQEAFTITGNTRAATFQGSVTTNNALTAAGNITANGNIVGDKSTNITNISTVTADNVVGNSIVDTPIISGRIKGNTIGTAASSISGVCEVVVYGSVYAGGNLTAGKVYYLAEDPSVSGAVSWRETDATQGNTSVGLLAVALGTSPSNGMLLRGAIVIDSSVLPNSLPGRTLFLKTAGGGIYINPPTNTGNIQRIVGHYIQTMATSSHSLIHFNPSQEFIEIA